MSQSPVSSLETTSLIDAPPVAYSYVRFSTAKQELGDSLRRQVQLAEEYAKRHGLQLSDRTFHDLGVSAFKRKNIKAGALAAFIAAVKTGAIAPGSYLLIEHFDRLSRAQVPQALRLLLDLVESGVVVVTLVDERVWDRSTVQDVTNLLTSIIIMGQAHGESKTKARRLRAVWDEKKKKAESSVIMTKECPRWLEVNDDRSAFVVLEDKVESIRKVFGMRLNGYGVVSIVRRANQEGWPVPGLGDTWHTSLVGRLLKNRALIGEYQPYRHYKDEKKESAADNDENEHKRVRIASGEPVKDYYPVVLDEQTFLRAQAVADRRGSFPGRRDPSLKNWLQGLLRCQCGKSFVRKNKGNDYARYYCTGRHRGVSECPGVASTQLEGAVLSVISGVAPQYFDGTARIEELKARADVLELDLSNAKQARDRYVEAIGTSRTPIAALMAKLADAEGAVANVESELARVRAEIADTSSDYDSVFENIARQIRSVDGEEARATLRENLSRIVDRVEVQAADGYIRVLLRGQDIPIVHPLSPDARLPNFLLNNGEVADTY